MFIFSLLLKLKNIFEQLLSISLEKLEMKPMKIATVLVCLALSVTSQKISAQNPENWTSKQLIEPAELAQTIQSGKDIPLIVSVGPGATIPNSIAIGMTKEKDNIDTLKSK